MMNKNDNTHYLLHVFTDRELKNFIKCPPLNKSNNRKDAVKQMKQYAHDDIVKGHYYFYKVIEQKMTTIDIYPSQETTGDIE